MEKKLKEIQVEIEDFTVGSVEDYFILIDLLIQSQALVNERYGIGAVAVYMADGEGHREG